MRCFYARCLQVKNEAVATSGVVREISWKEDAFLRSGQKIEADGISKRTEDRSGQKIAPTEDRADGRLC